MHLMLTLEDIKEKLKKQPEIDLLEILEIDSEMLVDRFGDLVEDRMDYFIEDLEDERLMEVDGDERDD